MPDEIHEGAGVADLKRQLEEMRKSRDHHMEQTREARSLLADAAEARDKALADGARWLAERDEARKESAVRRESNIALRERVEALVAQVRRGYGPTLKEVFGSLDGMLAHARSAARFHGNKEIAKAGLLELVTKCVPEQEMHQAVSRIELLSSEGPPTALDGLRKAVAFLVGQIRLNDEVHRLPDAGLMSVKVTAKQGRDIVAAYEASATGSES